MAIRSGLVLLGALVMLPAPSGAGAEVYRWVDQQGVAHYSEGLNSVPSQFRSGAKPVALPKSPPPAPEKPVVETPPAGADSEKKPAGDKPVSPAEPEKGKGPAG